MFSKIPYQTKATNNIITLISNYLKSDCNMFTFIISVNSEGNVALWKEKARKEALEHEH